MLSKVFTFAVALCCITHGATGTIISVINQCPYGITAYARHGSSSTNIYNLASHGGSQDLNVGSSFPAGLVYASRTGNELASEASIAASHCCVCTPCAVHREQSLITDLLQPAAIAFAAAAATNLLCPVHVM